MFPQGNPMFMSQQFGGFQNNPPQFFNYGGNQNWRQNYNLNISRYFWGLGIGDWVLGIGDWAQSPIPNPQSPIPNPHLKIINNFFKDLS